METLADYLEKYKHTTKFLSSPFGAKEARTRDERSEGCFLGFWSVGKVYMVAGPRRFLIFSLLLFFSLLSIFSDTTTISGPFLFDDINPFPSLPGSSFSFPTCPARGTRFTLHQEISYGLLGFYIAFSLIFC